MSGATVERRVSAQGWDTLGRLVRLHLLPAAPGFGIRFNRNVRARTAEAYVSDHSTCLGRGRGCVKMVEHLLAACYAEGITDLDVETDGSTLPLFDGSAETYRRLLVRAGIVAYETGPEPLGLVRPALVSLGRRFIVALPAESLIINCLLELPGIGRQFFRFRHGRDSFRRDVARARTFGSDSGLGPEKTRRRLRLGFALKRVAGLLHPARRRFDNESCRHKALDLLGDLALLGQPLRAEVFAFQPGHRLNIAFVKRLERSIR